MILSKHLKGEIGPSSSATILGLKVGGGKILDSDEVLEWNGRSLQGKTYEEVYDIIAESRHEPQVELIVSRQLSDVGRQPGRRHTHSGIGSRTLPEPGVDPRKLSEPVRDRRPSVTITSPGSPEAYGTKDHSPSISGRLQLKLWFDPTAQQLVVTIVSAAELQPRFSGHPRNPYAKMFLLPDRSEKSKRKNKGYCWTWNPCGTSRCLRLFEKSRTSVKVVVDLSAAALDDEPEWYYLSSHNETVMPHTVSLQRMFLLIMILSMLFIMFHNVRVDVYQGLFYDMLVDKYKGLLDLLVDM
ncbi:Regulating synaptic membrane exocytosis protein 2 [Armadillidium vulgare]|nr:Regulating synaptic membrane exocytosis protein 2 [Armadillidium vulgare]